MKYSSLCIISIFFFKKKYLQLLSSPTHSLRFLGAQQGQQQFLDALIIDSWIVERQQLCGAHRDLSVSLNRRQTHLFLLWRKDNFIIYICCFFLSWQGLRTRNVYIFKRRKNIIIAARNDNELGLMRTPAEAVRRQCEALRRHCSCWTLTIFHSRLISTQRAWKALGKLSQNEEHHCWVKANIK